MGYFRGRATDIGRQSESHRKNETRNDNSIYMQIWRTEQEYTRTRWTNLTFFLGISFAILGFSFQDKLVPSEALVIRIAGLFIYWFALALFMIFYRYTIFLRNYLVDMEKKGRTNIDLQSKSLYSPAASKNLSTKRLLFYFGLVYTFGVIALWFLHF